MEIPLQKDVMLRTLYKYRHDPTLFSTVFYRDKNEIAFAPENAAFPPTFDTTELRLAIQEDCELLDQIALFYYKKTSQNGWIICFYIFYLKR